MQQAVFCCSSDHSGKALHALRFKFLRCKKIKRRFLFQKFFDQRGFSDKFHRSASLYDKLVYDNLVYIIRKGRRKVNPWGEFFSPVFQQENKWKLLEIQYNKRDYDKSVYTTRNKGDVLRLLEEKTGSRPTPAACFLLLDRKSGRMPFIAPVLRFLAGSGHLRPAYLP